MPLGRKSLCPASDCLAAKAAVDTHGISPHWGVSTAFKRVSMIAGRRLRRFSRRPTPRLHECWTEAAKGADKAGQPLFHCHLVIRHSGVWFAVCSVMVLSPLRLNRIPETGGTLVLQDAWGAWASSLSSSTRSLEQSGAAVRAGGRGRRRGRAGAGASEQQS